jgi:hypothetical protein
MTPSRIEPATCWFVAQCLKHYATTRPLIKWKRSLIISTVDEQYVNNIPVALCLCIYRHTRTIPLLGIALEMNVSLPTAVRCPNFAQSIHYRNTKSSVGSSFVRASVIRFDIISDRNAANPNAWLSVIEERTDPPWSAPTLRAAAVGSQTPFIKNAAHHDVDLPQGGRRFENHSASCRRGSSLNGHFVYPLSSYMQVK